MRKSERLEKVQVQTELQVSAWTQQILITTNLSPVQLSYVLVMYEILFITQGRVFWLLCSAAHIQDK